MCVSPFLHQTAIDYLAGLHRENSFSLMYAPKRYFWAQIS